MPAMQQRNDMRAIGRRCLLAAMAPAIAALTGAAALAQDGVAAWRVECTPNQGDRLLVAALVRRPADAKTAQMTLQLPLGLNLTEAVQMRVDGGAAERQPIQTCTNIGCFVQMALNDKFVAAMRTGKDLKVVVQDPNKKPLEMSLPLLGFGLAYDKVRP